MRFLVFIYVCCLLISCTRNNMEVLTDNNELKLENGVLQYQNEPFGGFLASYYENQLPKTRAYYEDGRKEGEELKWHENGKIVEERFYQKGIKVGLHKAWWQDGTEKFQMSFNDKGAYDGTRMEWYKNGQLMLDFNYSNGKEVGCQRMWTDDGKTRANYVVIDGERFGLIGLKKCYSVTSNQNELN